jgi:hypothetical protein
MWPTTSRHRPLTDKRRCHVCGANAGVHETFFSGVTGLNRHIGSAHKRNGVDVPFEVTNDDILERCGRRLLSKEDVELIRAGEQPKVKITDPKALQGGNGGVVATGAGEGQSMLDDSEMTEYDAAEDIDDGQSGLGRTASASARRSPSIYSLTDSADGGADGTDGTEVQEAAKTTAQVPDTNVQLTAKQVLERLGEGERASKRAKTIKVEGRGEDDLYE